MSRQSIRPRLSVCCVTNARAGTLAAVLAPWRPVADELVVAIDDRLDPDEIDRVATLADRTLEIRFEHLEKSLASVHAACTSEWILRVDSDEVPSVALLEELEVLLSHPTARQWAVPRRWLHPDAAHWLDEVPWWPDYQLRLVRNEPDLQFSGLLHSGPEPLLPAGFAFGALYHLDCVASDSDARFRKTLLYDVCRPDIRAPHGLPMHRYYLPEGHLRRSPTDVPEVDRPAIDRLLDQL